MKIDDRHSTIIWADEKTYVDDADYRDFITKRIQDELSKAIMTALCTKDAIVVINGDSTTQKDELRPGIICRQDVYIKDLVQCKDCKYSVYEQWVDALDIYTCYRTSSAMANEHCRATDFCSWGERKDGGKNA